MAGSWRQMAAAAACLLALALAASTADAKAQHRGFIRMQDGKFVDQECREFNFVGANAWRWVQLASGTYPLSTDGNTLQSTDYLNDKGKKINPVLWAIKQLKKSGVTVVRFFGGGVTTDFKMIKTPGTAGANGKTWPNGKMNWDAVDGLDKIVGWCRAHGIKVIISFLDNWSPVDSKPGLVYAAGNATGQGLKLDDFYSNELVKNYYKNHVSFILNHVNKYTGLQFKSDPTILGYNLLNEPRCDCQPSVIDKASGLATEYGTTDCGDIKDCFTNVQAWVKEMAGFVKSIAPNQLIGLGDEGFATFLNNADDGDLVATNPGDWSPITGDSFSLQSTRGIDYCSTHMWVDDWAVAPALPPPYESDSSSSAAPANPDDFDFHRKWLAARARQAAIYKKPFVIEEFGKYIPRPATSADDIKRIRDPWFEDVFGIVEGSIKAGGPIHGVIMWKYGVSPYHNNTDKNWITVKDSTWTDIIQPLAKTLSKDKSVIRNCRPATGRAQAEGRGVSRPTASAATGSVTVKANIVYQHNRKLRGAGDDDTELWNYVSYGNDMAAVDDGEAIAGLPDITGVQRGPQRCARACGLNAECTAFHYNPDLGRCQLRKNVKPKYGFDADGWQTFWQEDLFED